jgi:hypothetical protein
VLFRSTHAEWIDNAWVAPKTVNTYREKINEWKARMNAAREMLLAQREAEIRANKTVGGKLKDFIEKESWTGDFTITLPVSIGISVSFGMKGGNLVGGYGAYGHEIMHEWDPSTGVHSETIMTRASVLPLGLGDLQTAANDLNDVLGAGSGKEFFKGKINPVGNIPTFDRTKGEGKTYTYNGSGELTDVTTIREDAVSASWGPLGASQATTTTHHQGFMSSEWNTETKRSLSFGPFSIHE